MSITADREVYALESRSESLEVTSFGDFVREGESDITDVGTGGLFDTVDGDEEAVYGSLTETHDHKLNRQIGAVETEIRGEFKIDGKDDMLMVTGAMAETQAGGMVTCAGQSDDLIGISGMRLTLVGDLWLAGLFGMEEKIASGVADGILFEICGLKFEREYLSSNYNGSFGYQNAAVTHTTAATTFFPYLKIVRGLRNQLPGSGAAEGEAEGEGGEASPAVPPPAAAEGTEGTGGADGVVRGGSSAGDDATQGVTGAAANAGEGAPVSGGTGGAPNTAGAANTAQTTSAATNTPTPGLLNGTGAGTVNAATSAAQPGVDIANAATPSTWRAAEKLAGLQNAEGAQHADVVSNVAHTDGVQHADQGAVGSQMDEMLAAAGGSVDDFDPNYDTIPAHRGQADGPPTGSGRDPLYDTIPAQQRSQAPDGTAGGRLGESGYAQIPGEELAPGQPAPQPGAPVRPTPQADPNATYTQVVHPPGWKPQHPKPTVDPADVPPPLPPRPDFTADEVANLGSSAPASRYAGEKPPAPGMDALLKQSFGYKQHMEGMGLEVEWRSGCWRPVLEEGAPPPRIGQTHYINGEWRMMETGATASDMNPGALPGIKDFGGRDPDTYARMRKLVGIAEGAAEQRILAGQATGDDIVAQTAARLRREREARLARILRKPKPEVIAHSPEVKAALAKLQAAADAAARSDAGNQWWDEGQRLMAAADRKIAEMEGVDSLDWVVRMGDKAEGVSATSAKAMDGMQKAVLQATDPTQRAVFGVRNPAYQGAAHAVSLRHVENTLNGGEAGHLIPKASKVTEQVGAVSVVRASDCLAVKSAPLKKWAFKVEDSAALMRVRDNLQKQLYSLKASRDSAEGATKTAINRKIAKIEEALASMQNSIPAFLTTDPVKDAAKLQSTAEDSGSTLLKTGGKAEDIAGSDLHQAADGGKSGWQPSPSIASVGDDGARRPPPGPQMDELGASWADSAGDATSISDGRPQNITVDQTIVVQRPDGGLEMKTVSSGARFDDQKWLSRLSNAEPSRGAGPTRRASRGSKIREWFRKLFARIRKVFSFGESASSGHLGVDSALQQQVLSAPAAPQESAALMDSIPGRAANQAGTLDAPPPTALSGEDARQFQSSLEGGDPVNPGAGDALETPGDGAKGIENNLKLQQTADGSDGFKAGDGAGDAGKGGDDAGGVGKGGDGAGGSGGAEGGGGFGGKPPPVPAARVELDNAMYRYERSFDQNWRKLNAITKESNEGSRLKFGTVLNVRDAGLDEAHARMTEWYKANINPDVSINSWGNPQLENYLGHGLKFMAEGMADSRLLAMQAEDYERAGKFVEGMRLMSEYMKAIQEAAAAKYAEDAGISFRANYNTKKALKALRKDAEYLMLKQIAKTGQLPEHVIGTEEVRLGRALTDAELEQLLAKHQDYWKLLKKAESMLAAGDDARALLARMRESAEVAFPHDLGVANSDFLDEVFGRAIYTVNWVVDSSHRALTGMPAPAVENVAVVSNFTESELAALLAKFDAIEATSHLDEANIADNLALPPAATGATEESANVNNLKPLTEEEGVIFNVSPDFPTVEVRPPDPPKAPETPPQGAVTSTVDGAVGGGKLEGVGEAEDAAVPPAAAGAVGDTQNPELLAADLSRIGPEEGADLPADPYPVNYLVKSFVGYNLNIQSTHRLMGSADLRAAGSFGDAQKFYSNVVIPRAIDNLRNIDPSTPASAFRGQDMQALQVHMMTKYANAKAAGDLRTANKYAEAMRRAQGYMGVYNKMCMEVIEEATKKLGKAQYDYELVEARLMAEPEYAQIGAFQDSGKLPAYVESARGNNPQLFAKLSAQFKKEADAWESVISLLRQGQDPRSLIDRHLDAQNYVGVGAGAAAFQKVGGAEAYETLRYLVDRHIAEVCQAQGVEIPPTIGVSKIESLFTKARLDRLMQSLDLVDARTRVDFDRFYTKARFDSSAFRSSFEEKAYSELGMHSPGDDLSHYIPSSSTVDSTVPSPSVVDNAVPSPSAADGDVPSPAAADGDVSPPAADGAAEGPPVEQGPFEGDVFEGVGAYDFKGDDAAQDPLPGVDPLPLDAGPPPPAPPPPPLLPSASYVPPAPPVPPIRPSAANVPPVPPVPPLPLSALPPANLVNVAADNRRWAASWRSLWVRKGPAGRDNMIRASSTVEDLRSYFFQAASERMFRMVQEIDPKIARADIWDEPEAASVNRAVDTELLRHFIAQRQLAAAEAGDIYTANKYAEILRRSAGYVEEADQALRRLIVSHGVREDAPYDTAQMLGRIKNDPNYKEVLAFHEKGIIPPDMMPLREGPEGTYRLTQGEHSVSAPGASAGLIMDGLTEAESAQIRMELMYRLAAWESAIKILEMNRDPRPTLLRRVDGFNYGLTNAAEYAAYGEVADAFQRTLDKLVGRGAQLPPLPHGGRIHSFFDEAEQAKLAALFDAIDQGAVVRHPSTVEDLSAGDGALVAADGQTPAVVVHADSVDDSHLDAWRNALKRAAEQEQQPVVYLDTGSVVPIHGASRDEGVVLRQRRPTLDRMLRPRSQAQFAPRQRSMTLGMGFMPSPMDQMGAVSPAVRQPVEAVQDVRFMFQDPNDLVHNYVYGGMWDHRLSDMEIGRYMNEPHINPWTPVRGTSPQGAPGRRIWNEWRGLTRV